MNHSAAFPLGDFGDQVDQTGKEDKMSSQAGSGKTTPGGQEEIKWEVVARTDGLIQAQIMAGRLQSEGIPVRAWQEAAGQVFGLSIGPMGTGYVAVPEEFVEQAMEILSVEDDAEE